MKDALELKEEMERKESAEDDDEGSDDDDDGGKKEKVGGQSDGEGKVGKEWKWRKS